MKSNKQRRAELALRRQKRDRKRAKSAARDPRTVPVAVDSVPCNERLLAPYNSYGVPDFVARGYYVDAPFECIDCKSKEIWRATQQKWWYEVAKGDVRTGARRCRPCRRAEQARRSEARRIHLEGIARKKAVKQVR